MTTGRGTRDEGRAVSRREFVGTVAVGAAAMALPSSLVPHPRFNRIERVGVQLYTVRDLVKQDFEGTLSRVGGAGYKEVEFAGYFNHTPEQVRAALDHAGLTAPSAHVGFDALEAGWEATVQTAHQVGHQFLVCAWIPEERRRTLDDWKHASEVLNHAGSVCKDAGIQFAYHNHNFEFVTLEGKVPYDVMLENTDPALVKLEIDLFWITFAGADPLAYFGRYPGRVPLVHVKDMRTKPTPDASPEVVMTDVGKGSIDWKGIFGHSGQAGIQHYFVEHDQPADPIASIKSSYDFLHGLDF